MASLISQLIGHQSQKENLIDKIKRDQFPSSLIFFGPSGVGKKFFAQSLLQVFNCKEAELSCGKCSNCLRTLHNESEFLVEITPEQKTLIGVDQIRELNRSLSLRTNHEARFVIIDPADSLSTQAANALLKILEETPPKTYFILITERASALLATIRSRAPIIRFDKLSLDQLKTNTDFDDVALNWCDGRLSRAQELSEPTQREELNKAFDFFYALLFDQPQDWKKLSPTFFNEAETRKFYFQIWFQALNKKLHQSGENLEWLPPEPQRLSAIHEQVENLMKDLDANVDKLLAVENFYYQLRA